MAAEFEAIVNKAVVDGDVAGGAAIAVHKSGMMFWQRHGAKLLLELSRS